MDKPVMTHRERVLAALHHQEPDRVPIDFGGARCSTIHLLGYENLKSYLGIDAPSIITDRMQQCVLVEEAILDRFDVDTRSLLPGPPDKGGSIDLDDRTYRDEWGVVRRMPPTSFWYEMRESPLAGEISLDEITHYPWPDPEDPGRVRGLREQALAHRQRGDYALILSGTSGPVHMSQYLRGFQDWYTDMAADQRSIGSLMDAVLEVTMAMVRNTLLAAGDLADIVLVGDDLGTQAGPQISPATYRKVIKPRHARLFRLIHDLCPHVKLALHSCGSVFPLIDDLIEIGVDVLNPIQVRAKDMDPLALKLRFGDRLCFWGGIDTQQVMPRGTTEEVKAEVLRRVCQLGAGGGYLLASVHNLQPDVPPENVVTMLSHAREVGAYPLMMPTNEGPQLHSPEIGNPNCSYL